MGREEIGGDRTIFPAEAPTGLAGAQATGLREAAARGRMNPRGLMMVVLNIGPDLGAPWFGRQS